MLSSGVGTSGGDIEFLERLSAVDLSGRARSAARAIRFCIFRIPPASRARRSAPRLRRLARSEPGALREHRRRRDRLAHRVLRAGVPHADGRAGAAGFLQGIASDARDVRREQGAHAPVRHQLPAGPPHGGARRALRDADARQLGPAHESEPRSEEELRHHRSAHGGAVEGSEAARPAGFARW